MNHDPLALQNPFNSPVFYVEETVSTMDDARVLASQGYPSGTVIRAGRQTAGRGRVPGRSWHAARGESLLCTILLRRAPPEGFTLRVGLAAAWAIDRFLPEGWSTRIKWPNDVLLGPDPGDNAANAAAESSSALIGKKLCGILCESDGSTLYAGTGFNLSQTEFPPEIATKATSLALIASHASRLGPDARTAPSPDEMLEVYLDSLEKALSLDYWRPSVEEKLLYKGERVRFLSGDPERGHYLEGTVVGIGMAGELLLKPSGQKGSSADLPAGTQATTPADVLTAPANRPTASATAGITTDPQGLLHLWSGEIPYPAGA